MSVLALLSPSLPLGRQAGRYVNGFHSCPTPQKFFSRKHKASEEYGVFEFPSVSGSLSVSESNGSAWIAIAGLKNLVDTDTDTDTDADLFGSILSMGQLLMASIFQGLQDNLESG